MSTQPSLKTVVLITGATGQSRIAILPSLSLFHGEFPGYIGGSVFSTLLNLPERSRIEFRLVVRNAEKAKKLNDLFGVKTIIGSHSDQDLMSKEAAEADVVLAMADCDDVNAVEGVLEGLKKRFKTTGQASILIHTSGTGILWDRSKEDGAEGIVWDDEDVAQLDKIPPDAFHRQPELKVLAADQEAGYVKTYIVCPGIIYDITRNPLVEAGIANATTAFFSALVPVALKRGAGILPLEGKNHWPNVHIEEVADLYVLLFNAALADEIPHGKEGYFFACADEHQYSDVYDRMSGALFDMGKVKSPVSTPYSKEEAQEHFGDGGFMYSVITSDVRCVGNRGKRLGWKPKKTTKDFLDVIPREVEYVLNK
ncbi:NAD-binding protein [Marasmius fiardii PR-910]|nr:NAD-binding protein [Marasmius fiardii PR-910]